MSRFDIVSQRLRAAGFVAGLVGALTTLALGAPGVQAACLSTAIAGDGLIQLLADDRGIGGTGLTGDDDGIGGTGLDRHPDGIGGTGLEGTELADTGPESLSDSSLDRIRASGTGNLEHEREHDFFEGVITSFGDVCPGGLRFELDDDSIIEEGGEALSARALRIGHVVRLDAEPVGRSHYASTISLTPLLDGPVTAIDAVAGLLEVMGEIVEIAPTVRIEDEDSRALDLDDIGVGDSLVVHGGRSEDGRVIATYIGRRTRSDLACVRGLALPSHESSAGPPGLRIGQVRVIAADDEHAVAGRWVQARGRWDMASATLAEVHFVEPRAVDTSTRGAAIEIDTEETAGVRLHLGQWPPTSTR